MSKERELLERLLKNFEQPVAGRFGDLFDEVRTYLAEPEVNMYAHPNLVIDECIKIIKVGMTRDGHNTPQYKQSIRHIKDLESLKLEGV